MNPTPMKQPRRRYETNRLLLKAREISHADEMFALIDSSREHLRPWMPWEERTLSVEDSRKYLEMACGWWESGSTFDFSVYEKNSGRMIGSFGLHSIDWSKRKCELGYWIGKEVEGHGYVTEAVRLGEVIALELGFHRVLVTCDRLNQRSQRVPLRCGYKLEALQVDECKLRETWRDTLVFSKLLNPSVAGRVTENLPYGFSILNTDGESYRKAVGSLSETIYEDQMSFWAHRSLSEEDKAKLAKINENYKNHSELYLILYCGDRLAGWCVGYQDTRESFCMSNSAVLPEFRGRGLYSRLLEEALQILTERGFQKIWSLHQLSNNAVIVPKLKRGFVITGTSTNELAGGMVQLCYFPNSTRKKVFDFRVGAIRPDAELKQIFKIE